MICISPALAARPVLAAPPTPARCQADYNDMMASIEQNRVDGLAEINQQLAGATADQKAALEEIRETVWMQEEQDRRQADFFRNDCLKAAKK